MKEFLKIFKALSNETRLKIVESLLDNKKCVCEIIQEIKKTQPTISNQLKKLEDLEILESTKKGKKNYYKLKNKKIIKILDIIRE